MENFSVKLIPFFNSRGLHPAPNIQFHNFNLIIGKNGSGKTRFLKAVEAYYQKNLPEKAEIVTLYFPEISSFSPLEQEQKQDENITAELGSAIFNGESLNFQDF